MGGAGVREEGERGEWRVQGGPQGGRGGARSRGGGWARFSKYKNKALQDGAEWRKRDESVWGRLSGLDSAPSFHI